MASKTTAQDGLLLVLDAGSGGGRCLVVDTAGKEVAFAYRPWTMKVPPENSMGSVFDPEEWWGALVDAAREALAKAGTRGVGGGAAGPTGGTGEPASGAGRRILAVSTTSLRDGVVFLDGDGREVYCGTNRDGRAIGLGFEIAQSVGERQWHITGRWPLGLDAAARLLWFKREAPEVLARVRHVLMVSDWLVYRLSGALSVEPTNASSSGLFDMERGTWSAELAAAHGFDPAILPPVRWPGEVAGRLAPATAATLGLPEGLPVVTGLGDSQSGCLGSGAWEPGDTTIIAGTTAPVLQVAAEPFRDPSHRIWSGAYAAPGRWAVESNAGTAGTVYAWFAENFVRPEETETGDRARQATGKAGREGMGRNPYAVLEEEVAAAPAGQVLAWLGPAVADFSALAFPSEATIKFPALGFFCTPSRGMPARAVLENIAFALRGNVEQLPAKPDLVRVCGGLSRSRAFLGILASVLGTRVAAPAVREATGAGAAIAAAVGAGAYPDLAGATRAMVDLSEVVEPDPDLVGLYAGVYPNWRAGYGK